MLSRCGISKLSSGNHTVGSREPTKTVFVLVLQRLHCHARFVLAGIVFSSFCAALTFSDMSFGSRVSTAALRFFSKA